MGDKLRHKINQFHTFLTWKGSPTVPGSHLQTGRLPWFSQMAFRPHGSATEQGSARQPTLRLQFRKGVRSYDVQDKKTKG